MAIHGMWHVGGHVRDALMGIPSKDIDIAVECDSFDELLEHITATHAKLFEVKPEYLTIRALTHQNEPRDYVMCRKDGAYSDGRRPDEVIPGTILDDLARRDFTVNAIAKHVDTGEILDPYGGIEHIERGELHCVGSAEERFTEDGLRILRALRFLITRGLACDEDILAVFENAQYAKLLRSVSVERITVELQKCFKHNTYATLRLLTLFAPEYLEIMFQENKLWLLPTTRS